MGVEVKIHLGNNFAAVSEYRRPYALVLINIALIAIRHIISRNLAEMPI